MNIEFCFFHIEKCAGSSIKQMLFEYFEKIYDTKYILDYNLTTVNDLLYIQQLNCKVLLGHCNFNETNITDSFSKTCCSIICVREPMERWLSHYYYFMNPTRKFCELSDDEINNLFNLHICNLLTIKLSGYNYCLQTALINLKSINCILIFDQLSNDIGLLENKLNEITNTTYNLILPITNVSNSYSKDDYIRIQQFKHIFEDDIQIYNHILNLNNNDRFKYL